MTAACAFAGENDKAATWLVLPESARLRAAPDDQSKVVGTVKQDAILTQQSKICGDWLPVAHGEGTAYIHWGNVLLQTHPEIDQSGNIPVGYEQVDRETPLPLDYKPTDLVAIDKKWDYHTEGVKHLRKEANTALDKLFRAARADGVYLHIVSAYRSAAQQKYLYLRKLKKAGPGQQLVAKPGHSEHQLGTTIDVSGSDPKTVLKTAFADTREGKWLRENAAQHGFRFTYTEATQEKTGFKPEPWHIRYMGQTTTPEPALPAEDIE